VASRNASGAVADGRDGVGTGWYEPVHGEEVSADRGGWLAFASDSLLQAVGTLMAAGVIYLIAVGSGVITSKPFALLLATIAVGLAGGLAVGAIVSWALKPRLFRRRAQRLLRDEPDRVVAALSKLPDVPSSFHVRRSSSFRSWSGRSWFFDS
jgi:hypothetical protein